jgi:hypothetical protein
VTKQSLKKIETEKGGDVSILQLFLHLPSCMYQAVSSVSEEMYMYDGF